VRNIESDKTFINYFSLILELQSASTSFTPQVTTQMTTQVTTPIYPNTKHLSSSLAIAAARAAVAHSTVGFYQTTQSRSFSAGTSNSNLSTKASMTPSNHSQSQLQSTGSSVALTGKRGRGRPRKYFATHSPASNSTPLSPPQQQPTPKGKVGRPKSAINSLQATQIAKKQRKCPYCPQVYYGQSVMQDHITSVHLKGAKHTCSLCQKKYTWRITLRKHLKKDHNLSSKEIHDHLEN
jgi:Drought induced 19 protein (Di19), zinc-binding/AT hook motif